MDRLADAIAMAGRARRSECWRVYSLPEPPDSERPDDDDVIIWHLPDREELDVYRVTKGAVVLGEFTGRSIGSTVFQAAVQHVDPGRAVWLKDDRPFRRVNATLPKD